MIAAGHSRTGARRNLRTARRRPALADGRELIYFDDEPADDAGPRALDDRASCRRSDHASEMRYDPLLDEWVAIAAHRQDRTHLPPTDECPLCPSAPGGCTEIPAERLRRGRVREPVPVLRRRIDARTGRRRPPPGRDCSPGAPAAGRCEVVCFTADHDVVVRRPARPSGCGRCRGLGRPHARRCRALPGVEQVFCFENRGEEIGVTLRHPHGQIYAYPFVTPRTPAHAAIRPPQARERDRRQPVRRRAGRRAYGRGRGSCAETSTGRRSSRLRRALAVRGAPLPAPARCPTCPRSTPASGTN